MKECEAIISTPIGTLNLVVNHKAVKELSFIDNKNENTQKNVKLISDLPPNLTLFQKKLIQKVVKEINLYFQQKLKKFTFPLDISSGSKFQQKVWGELLTINYGKTNSYSDIAIKIKNQNSSRAVGTACSKNPIILAIPCHRVLPKNKKIGNYSAGGAINKKFLLNLEKFHKSLRKN